MNNILIGLGNAGCQVVKATINSSVLDNVSRYCIDSQANVDLATINTITTIPIISDEKSGSGRNRERGRAMFKFHEENGAFDKMYDDASNSKEPVLVITSAAGGTGSGSVVPLCETLIGLGIQVIPIIICPNMDDPDAYHLNTNDLMMELAEVGIETYSIFRNTRGDADYTSVNNDIVSLIEIILGKRYHATDLDSIDDSDLDVILNTPGRFLAVSASGRDINTLKKELTRKVFSGYQPAWTDTESENHTLMTAYSLTSMFAKQDFREVFDEVNRRIRHVFDEYRNICENDNNGVSEATLIVAGLPRAEMKTINSEFKESKGIATGMNKSVRPGFVNRKKASVTESRSSGKDGDNSVIKKFNWT